MQEKVRKQREQTGEGEEAVEESFGRSSVAVDMGRQLVVLRRTHESCRDVKRQWSQSRRKSEKRRWEALR